jgi:hypothetical protein
MINAAFIINNQGKPRLCKFYEYMVTFLLFHQRTQSLRCAVFSCLRAPGRCAACVQHHLLNGAAGRAIRHSDSASEMSSA